ncbi:AMP-binding enzyme family protein [Mycobacterium kansasii]|uniref:AMP-binding enzyme family protein n=1 Tax=Mycobacterium kansasii TaxID=1768 RepID=A0A1V3X5Y0_MYCKA|nr:AMP-binding enzyme family protein [Mycobacterium kansasii]
MTTSEHALSYAELDAHAAALAAQLPQVSDPAAPARVAMYLPPSAEHVVALLAAARLNVTAVPLDPAYPAELLGQILRQAEPLCVLMLPGAEAEVAAVAPDGVPRLVVTLAAAAPAIPCAAAPHDGRRPCTPCSPRAPPARPRASTSPTARCATCCTGKASTAGLPAPR